MVLQALESVPQHQREKGFHRKLVSNEKKDNNLFEPEKTGAIGDWSAKAFSLRSHCQDVSEQLFTSAVVTARIWDTEQLRLHST